VSLGEKIRKLLKANGLEQQDLAKKLRVAPNSVSDWVQGKTYPRHKRLPALAKALKTTVAELVA
jgi:transcriptional regulator with XRE-family HTH domain